jgi:predicted nucleic acid-binding protein
VARVLRRVVVDAGPIVSVLLGDAAGPTIASELAGRACEVSVVNVGEVLDVLTRVHRVEERDAADAVRRYLDEGARPIPATLELAERAALVRSRHYHRRERDVSLADCFAIATALPDGEIATSDAAVARVAAAEGLHVLALPDSRGRRPKFTS